MRTIIKEARIINEGKIFNGDVLIRDGRIERIDASLDIGEANEIRAEGLYLMPGIIDDQVHFREPGMPHKADIASESRAGLAGGVTSFMEMPNTKPNAVTQGLLQDKYDRAAATAYANYSFFMGATNDNLDEVLKTDAEQVCGVKVFMGSSTGNMLVDDRSTLEHLFSNCPMLIATHCEDEETIRQNLEVAKASGRELNASDHPIIRNEEGCLKSSSLAVGLAKKYGTRLHVLHITTADELKLFDNAVQLRDKRVTAEVCVHHLYFSADDYATLGNKIKCNPAVKAAHHKVELFQALLDDRLDIIATDHAPHTADEKAQPYLQAPSGLPLLQHSLNVMLHFYLQGQISLERIVEKMCHAPAECFRLRDRGYIREGYWADLVLFDPSHESKIVAEDVLYRCGWSPLEGKVMPGRIEHVFLNGDHVVRRGEFLRRGGVARLQFEKDR